ADLLRERSVQVGEIGPRLEPQDELGRRAHADVRVDQRLLEPLPRLVVSRIECSRRQLLRQRPAALRERLAQPAEEAALLVLGLVRGLAVAEELCPASRHRVNVILWPWRRAQGERPSGDNVLAGTD